MRIQHLSKADLLKVIEILLLQIQEEQKLRMDCIKEMLSARSRLSEKELLSRIKKILESPGETL
jgi:hypothetical protein